MIFRIDHFLSSELVRRVVTLRFLNRVFEPIWNAVHIQRVDISWLESLTLEGRASYYDTAGAIGYDGLRWPHLDGLNRPHHGLPDASVALIWPRF